MQRKHTPGCLCCGCEEIDVGSLPTLTISGWTTDGVWSGSDCCKCLTFTPTETPAWTCTLSPVIATQQRTVNAEYQLLALPAAAPMVYCGEGNPVGGDDDVCCQGDPVAVVDNELETIEKSSYRLKIKYRPASITVCVSRAPVTCDGSGIGTKWIVRSVYNYTAGGTVVADLYSKTTHVATLNNACFEKVYLPPGSNCPDNCERTRLASCEDDNDPIRTITGFPSPSFTRVKFYDALPSGSVSFTSADTPENCTWDFCENPTEYLDSYCLTVPSSSVFLDCLCAETLADPPVETVTATKNVWCCTACGGSGPPFIGQQWTSLPASEPCDVIGFPAGGCPACPAPDSCGTWVFNRIAANAIPLPTSGDCWTLGGINSPYLAQEELWETWFIGSLYDSCFFDLTRYHSWLWTQTREFPECYEPVDGPCPGDCFWHCTCGYNDPTCWHKWQAPSGGPSFKQNVLSLVLDWDCVPVGDQAACIDAPASWSVTFA